MKWRYYLYSLLGCVLFFSCYDEDTLTVDESGEDFASGLNSREARIHGMMML